jgi:chlorophyll/bacteriochlorophyll a synthase
VKAHPSLTSDYGVPHSDSYQVILLAALEYYLYVAIVLLLVVSQITFQDTYFLRDPLKNDIKYQASAQPFLVLGMLMARLALGWVVESNA